MKFKFKVEIIESERGWGQKIDSVKKFDTKDEAVNYINDFNKDNDEDVVPAWYMYARPANFNITT